MIYEFNFVKPKKTLRKTQKAKKNRLLYISLLKLSFNTIRKYLNH